MNASVHTDLTPTLQRLKTKSNVKVFLGLMKYNAMKYPLLN